MEVFVELARGALFVALAVAFLVLAWMFLRLAKIFSTTEETIKEVSEQVVPLLGKTHVTVDNINSQLSQLDTAVGDVADITGELDQTTAVITRGVRGGVIKVSSATAEPWESAEYDNKWSCRATISPKPARTRP